MRTRTIAEVVVRFLNTFAALLSVTFLIAVLSSCASRVQGPLTDGMAERQKWSAILDQLGDEQIDIWITRARRQQLGPYSKLPPPARAAIWGLVTGDFETTANGKLTVDDVERLQRALK